MEEIENAVQNQNVDKIRELSLEGTLEYVAEENPNLLHLAIRKESLPIVELLLEAEFDPNAIEIKEDDSGRSPIYWAVFLNNNHIVNLLRRYGAFVSDSDIAQATRSNHQNNNTMLVRNLQLVRQSQSSF